MNDKRLFMVCTETSGDALGASLIHHLKAGETTPRLFGVGGQCLKAEGMTRIFTVEDFNVLGLVEVLSQLRRLKAQFQHLVKQVEELKPDIIVLIDAPDFNLRFAKAVRHLGVPIIYYVSPQVWAWRKGRAKNIAKLVDHMMVLFRFEVPLYQEHGLPTTWVGHPLTDQLMPPYDLPGFRRALRIDNHLPIVALAPGSRHSEIRRHLPVMCEIARRRREAFQCVMPLAPHIAPETLESALQGAPVVLAPGGMRDVMRHADAAVVASGTATLETAMMKTPMIVGYRLNPLTYWLLRGLVSVPHIALVNIVLGEGVVPELVQSRFNAPRVLNILDRLIQASPQREAMMAKFNALPDKLGRPGSGARAAEVVRRYLLP